VSVVKECASRCWAGQRARAAPASVRLYVTDMPPAVIA
jgi:hypothetical protein